MKADFFTNDHFLVGWGNTPIEPAFGGARDDAASVKAKLINLISSVRTLMRSEWMSISFCSHTFPNQIGRGGGKKFGDERR